MQVFVNSDSTDNVVAIAKQLSEAVKQEKEAEFKAFVVFIKADEKAVAKLAEENKIDNVGFVLVKGPDDPALKAYKIDTSDKVRNTVIVYANKTVTAKFVNLDADKDAKRLKKAIAEACKQKPKAKKPKQKKRLRKRARQKSK